MLMIPFLCSVTHAQVTVAILLNSFVGAITSAEEEAALAAASSMKSKEMLRFATQAHIKKSS